MRSVPRWRVAADSRRPESADARDMLTLFSSRSPFARRVLAISERKNLENANAAAGGFRFSSTGHADTEDEFMKLYVGNLSYNISDDQLRDLFARFGNSQSAQIVTDRASGQSKGFGFVEFANDDEAKAALSLNGTEFGGRNLTVSEARPRAEASGNRRY